MPDGRVVAVYGPYGNDHDDEITKHALEQFSELKDWSQDEDMWITDRGFHLLQSEIQDLIGSKVQVQTPAYLRGRSQFTEAEVMESTATASARSISECVHARTKYPPKLLFNLFPVKMLPPVS